ncbi:hypothetical protein D3C81_1890520 [compost metagenome]
MGFDAAEKCRRDDQNHQRDDFAYNAGSSGSAGGRAGLANDAAAAAEAAVTGPAAAGRSRCSHAGRICRYGRRTDFSGFIAEVPEYFLEPEGELHAERVHLCLCRQSAAESDGTAGGLQPPGD